VAELSRNNGNSGDNGSEKNGAKESAGKKFLKFLIPDDKRGSGSSEAAVENNGRTGSRVAGTRTSSRTGTAASRAGGTAAGARPSSRTSSRTGTGARKGSHAALASGSEHPLGYSDSKIKLLTAILIAVAVIDLAAFALIASRSLFTFTDKLCYAFGLDGVSFVSHSFKQVEIIIAYVIDALLGGFMVWVTMNIASGIAENAFLPVTRRTFLWLTAGFMALFLILTVISTALGNGYDTYRTYRFMAPLMVYLGGTVMLGLSALRFDIQ